MTNTPLSKKPALAHLLKVADVSKILCMSRIGVKALIDSGDLTAAAVTPSEPKRKARRVHVRITRDSVAAFYKKRFHRDMNSALQTPAS